MAVQTITYDNKSYINQNADIPNINKVNDTDMNEIKSVVNNNASELTALAGQFGDYIIEEGGDYATNYYIKYENGIMIQYGDFITSQAISSAIGSVYRTPNAVQKSYVENFIDTNYVLLITTTASIHSFYINQKSTTGFEGYAIGYNTLTAGTRHMNFMAIGRWKA